MDESKQISDQQQLLVPPPSSPSSSSSSQSTFGDVNGGDVVVNTPTDGGATTTTISSDGSPTDFSSNTNPIEHPEWSCLSVSTTGTPAVVGSPRGTLSKMSFPNELCKYKTVIRHSFITQGVPENTELLVNGYGTLVSSSALLPNWKNNKFMLNQFSVGLLLEIPKQQNPGQNSENSTINTIKFNK